MYLRPDSGAAGRRQTCNLEQMYKVTILKPTGTDKSNPCNGQIQGSV